MAAQNNQDLKTVKEQNDQLISFLKELSDEFDLAEGRLVLHKNEYYHTQLKKILKETEKSPK